MRAMAIDYGDSHVGVAFSDILKTIAGEAFVLNIKNVNTLSQKIIELTLEKNVDVIVVGNPLNLNGTISEQTEKTIKFVKKLEQLTDLSIVMQDERRTSVDAHRILHTSGIHGRKNKHMVDAVAATLILESYLNSIKNRI